jgi:hypothetical protein
MDFAHIYSNLTTPAAFYYGGGDLLISNTSPDQGVSFITGFTFDETLNATTVIGSQPGTDGTRLIMIMVPPGTPLNNLTPLVTCAEGSFISSPAPAALPTSPTPGYTKGEIDFTNPTIWTAQAKNGAVQQYTVVVSQTPVPPAEKRITYFFFEEFPTHPAIIDQTNWTINVIVPSGTKTSNSTYALTPIVSFIGDHIAYDDGSEAAISGDGLDSPMAFSPSPTLRVYAVDNSYEDYAVLVLEALNTDAKISRFAFDGYPDAIADESNNPSTDENFVDNGTPDGDGYYPIQVTLPYGVSLKTLKPLINYIGQFVTPNSGVTQNFSGPVNYMVTAWDTTTTQKYKVTVKNKPANANAGIFDFRVTNVPNAKVVIGEKPRQDGKIPIVIQVPFGTNDRTMVAGITLSSPDAQIHPFVSGAYDPIAPANGVIIPFGNNGNTKEAVYRVTAQDGTIQDYVAVVSAGGQYYYVEDRKSVV